MILKKMFLGAVLAVVATTSMAESFQFVQKISGLSKSEGIYPIQDYGLVRWYRAYPGINTEYRPSTTANVMANTPYTINDNTTTTFTIDGYGKISVVTAKASYGTSEFNGYVFEFLDKQVVGVKDNTGNVDFEMRGLANGSQVPSLNVSGWSKPIDFDSTTPIGAVTIEISQ